MGIIRFFLSAFHLCIIALLFGVLLNAYISPKFFGALNLLSLGFPILMIINILLIIFWIVTWKKRALIFIIISLCFINPTRRWINYSKPSNETSNLKLISLNGKFGNFGNDEIYSFLNNEKPDVVFFQEFDNTRMVDGLEYAENDYPIVKIQSKYPIIKKGLVKTDVSTGMCIYADIDVDGKIIRLVNVYMEPFFIKKDMVKPTDNLKDNENKAKSLIKTLIPTFKKHQTQIDTIKDFVNQSPYPVIVAGDFNAVPNSYEYYKISENLSDAFFIAGKGSGTSFHDFKFPNKIDHIFSSESIKPIRYKVDRSETISDHFPLIAEFRIK